MGFEPPLPLRLYLLIPIFFHCFKLAVFRCLIITATEKTDRSKGTITSQENSGTVEVEDGEGVSVVPIVEGGVFRIGAFGFGAVKKGAKFTVPKLKSFLLSKIDSLMTDW